LLTKAKVLSAQSNGLFNPAIGQLIQAWGYQRDEPPQGPPPDDATIKQLLALQPSMQDFEIKGVRINNTNPAIRFDLGAIGKGYAVEQLVINLKNLGVQHMLIGAAGDIKAVGQHGNRPWQIGIRHPRAAGVIASTALNDGEVISTSGDYERFYEYNGKRYHHIIDPRTGYPANASTSVTVIHTDAVVADAAATALFIAGPNEWPTIAKQMGVAQVMLIDPQGKVYLSRGMQARLKFEVEPPPVIEIVDLP
jgi:FAD:protein FMN transferase